MLTYKSLLVLLQNSPDLECSQNINSSDHALADPANGPNLVGDLAQRESPHL